MEKFSENYYEEKEIDENEEVFQKYIEDLELTPEDFDKKILDIGAGNAGFSKWAKDHHVSSEIYSLDIRNEMEEKENSVVGIADKLPFKDDSFDLIISTCAIPNVLNTDQIEKTLLETIRVVKPGGEIRLAKVSEGDRYEPQRIKKEELNSVFKKLENEKIIIEKIRQPQDDLYEYDGHVKTDRLLAETYLIKIKKPEA